MRPIIKSWSKIASPFLSIFMLTILFAISFFSLFLTLQFHHNNNNGFKKSPATIDHRNTITMILNHVEDSTIKPDENDDVLALPSNITTRNERTTWLKHNLKKFKIFESTPKSKSFDLRVSEFFTLKDCTTRFFIIWISPSNRFGKRELLSLESLFRAHPKGCVVIISQTMDSNHGLSILEPLLARGFNVLPITPDLPLLFSHTPAQSWLEGLVQGSIDPGSISLAQNLSNLIRLVVVYKYGGVYMDIDFIILKDMSSLRNSIGAQSIDEVTKVWTRLNNAMLIFDKGHPLLLKFMEEFASNFNGNRWGYNGPFLVSRVVEMVISNCSRSEITVLPPMAFYPVDWIKIKDMFKRPNSTSHANWAHNKLVQISKETYGVHLWNKESSKVKVEEGSIMGNLISKCCVVCLDIYDS